MTWTTASYFWGDAFVFTDYSARQQLDATCAEACQELYVNTREGGPIYATDTDTIRNALSKYEYRTESQAILYPTIKRYLFNPMINRLPRWLHANVLTATSGVLSIFVFATLLWIAAFSGWDHLLLVTATMWWWRDTLDNLDGGQARRTGTSGPMGELMDHTIDSYTVYPVILGVCLAFGVAPVLTLITVGVSLLGFWGAMWELRHRGIFFTGVLSETEGAWILTGMLLGGGIFGIAAINTPFVSFVSVLGIIVFLTIFGFGYQLLTSMQRVSEWKARSEVLPVAAVIVALILWFVRADGAVSLAAVGLLMCMVAGRTIVDNIESRLYGTPFNALSFSTIGVFAVACGFTILGPTWGIAQELIAYALVGALTLDALARLYFNALLVRRVTGMRVFHVAEELLQR